MFPEYSTSHLGHSNVVPSIMHRMNMEASFLIIQLIDH